MMRTFKVKFIKDNRQVYKTHKLGNFNDERILGGYYSNYLNKKIDNLVITNLTDGITYDYDNTSNLKRA